MIAKHCTLRTTTSRQPGSVYTWGMQNLHWEQNYTYDPATSKLTLTTIYSDGDTYSQVFYWQQAGRGEFPVGKWDREGNNDFYSNIYEFKADRTLIQTFTYNDLNNNNENSYTETYTHGWYINTTSRKLYYNSESGRW